MYTNWHLSVKITGISLLSAITVPGCQKHTPAELPNILWITSEDNSPFLGCYGDSLATTPNLDRLAAQGFRYTHAYANAPVCAPARNTIITGIYACSGGNQHMRSTYLKSDVIRFYPEFLRQIGYYCTNNSKEDYNIDLEQTRGIWDESSKKAHYRSRKPGQPFFAVFNTTLSHESSLHRSIPTEELRHDPASVKLPPYHPDTPEMRHDWAQYYDKLEEMDVWVGKVLDELEESGEAGNTIVFYYGDHGGVLGRSKRFVYESGTRVPLLIRIPGKYRHFWPESKPGRTVDRLVSFVDLAPTLLSMTGISIPDWMQGHAFLGGQKTADPEYVFMFRNRMDERIDLVRTARDERYRYIRNYMPHRISGQHISYLWRAPSMHSWEQAFREGSCNEIQSAFWQPKPAEELYDTENDPWEVHNLAAEPAYREVLVRMRTALDTWMLKIHDTGFIPEAELQSRIGLQPAYDYMRSGQVNLKKLMEVAGLASQGRAENLPRLLEGLKNEEPAVRYWSATGLLILKNGAKPAIPALKSCMKDTSPEVAIVAAEALYELGKRKVALEALLKALSHEDVFVRTSALNALDVIGESGEQTRQAVFLLSQDKDRPKGEPGYDLRLAEWLLARWEDQNEGKIRLLKSPFRNLFPGSEQYCH